MTEVQGVLVVFDDPESILKAAAATRDQGFKQWDVFTPFPVHGMDEAMGLGRSNIPWITFTLGAIGCLSGLGIQLYTMVHNWPQNYGGKPFLAWPAFVPITFETTVFFAGIGTAVGALLLGGVLRMRKKRFHPKFTDDRFGLFVSAKDPKFDIDKVRTMFDSFAPKEIKVVEEGKS